MADLDEAMRFLKRKYIEREHEFKTRLDEANTRNHESRETLKHLHMTVDQIKDGHHQLQLMLAQCRDTSRVEQVEM